MLLLCGDTVIGNSVPLSLKVVQDRPHCYLFDLRYLAESMKMDEKIPEAAFTAAKGAEDDKVTTTFDAMLRLMALAQRKANVRIVMSIVEANGDVLISKIFDAQGQTKVPYARVDRLTSELKRL